MEESENTFVILSSIFVVISQVYVKKHDDLKFGVPEVPKSCRFWGKQEPH